MPIGPGINPYRPRVAFGYMEYPPSDYAVAVATAIAAVSGASDSIWCVLQAPETGTITSIDLQTGTVTTGATSVDIRLESLDASGNPSGNLLATNTNKTFTLNATDDNQILSQTLTAGASVTKGQMFAVVMQNPASSPGNWALRGIVGGNAKVIPYGGRTVAGVATKNGTPPSVGLNYNGTYYKQFGNAIMDGTGLIGTAINNTTTERETGNQFIAPFAARVSGCYVNLTNASNVAFDMILYEGSTAVLTRSMSGVERRAAGLHYISFNGKYTIKPGVLYRIVMKPTTATNISYQLIQVGSAAQLATLTGADGMKWSSKNNSAAWSSADTWLVCIGVLFDAIGL